jgi:hypothetical protein
MVYTLCVVDWDYQAKGTAMIHWPTFALAVNAAATRMRGENDAIANAAADAVSDAVAEKVAAFAAAEIANALADAFATLAAIASMEELADGRHERSGK